MSMTVKPKESCVKTPYSARKSVTAICIGKEGGVMQAGLILARKTQHYVPDMVDDGPLNLSCGGAGVKLQQGSRS